MIHESRFLNYTGAGDFTFDLPTADGIVGRVFRVKNSGTATLTINASGSETIDDVGSIELATQYESVTLVSTGTNWIIT